MAQETFINPETQQSVTTICVGCPHCRAPIRFIAPPSLVDSTKELEFWRRRADDLAAQMKMKDELYKMAWRAS